MSGFDPGPSRSGEAAAVIVIGLNKGQCEGARLPR